MAQQLIDDLSDTLRQKERELIEVEEAYYRQKKDFENREIALDSRLHFFRQLIVQEEGKMAHLLGRYKAGRDEARDFYRVIQQLTEESELTYRKYRQDLDFDQESYQRHYKQKREKLETEIHQLRRKEHDTDN